MARYNETNICDEVTTNGDYPTESPERMNGDRILGFYGDLGGATVTFVFFTQTPDDQLVELPASPDWTFTSKPPPERFSFSFDLPFKVRVTGATGSTNFGINTHQLD